jgi:BirA family biotin operon repressor/biotin-[acetyl-CoA-carboxylase] ligase
VAVRPRTPRGLAGSELSGAPIDLNRLTAALIGRVLLAYERFIEGEHRDTFAELWNKYDVLRGREVTLTEAGRKRHGRVLGIDDSGSLLLRDDKGPHPGIFRAGEVTIDKES